MNEREDFWADGDFEDTVASTLISCFETNAKKNSGAAPSDRLNDERLAMLRNTGPYICSNSRQFIFGSETEGEYFFDTVNDVLPKRGCFAVKPTPGSKLAESNPKAYLEVFHVRQVESLGKHWRRRDSGVIYEMLTMSAESDGIDGERRFFTVNKNGGVKSCEQVFLNNSSNGGKRQLLGHPLEWLEETSAWGSIALQAIADQRFCWTITAQEKFARARIGCMREEVKSLLYARSLPMTETGRKRPILHLVESHKRRMKNGIDIDIVSFLRGEQVVEIGGTVFKVSAPESIRSSVSSRSQKKYYQPN